MPERKLAPPPLKLTEAVAADYPGAEIRVSFPKQWALIGRLPRDDVALYVAGFPLSQEQPRADQFFGLPPEINHAFSAYRLYKLFEPYHTPHFQVAWDTQPGQGQIIGQARPHIQLQPIAQAQIWTGEGVGLIWEVYFFETRRGGIDWLTELTLFWQAVEQDMKVDTIFTQPQEPTFQEGYPDFLLRLGYRPDPRFEGWWCKQR